MTHRTPTRRVTANLPADLLDSACRSAGTGITKTLIEGLHMVQRARAASKARRLKGKLKLNIDIEKSRERTHR